MACESPNYKGLLDAWYSPDEHDQEFIAQVEAWLATYKQRLDSDGGDSVSRIKRMNLVNPKYVFRNYLAQQAIDKAEAGDDSMVNELLTVLSTPYSDQPEYDHYASKRPDWAKIQGRMFYA